MEGPNCHQIFTTTEYQYFYYTDLIYQGDPTKIFGVVLNIRTLKVVLGILLNVSLFCIEHRAPGAKSAKNGWLDHFLILEKN